MINNLAKAQICDQQIDARKVSGFKSNVEKLTKKLDCLAQNVDFLKSKINCTLTPSTPVCGEMVKGDKCQNEPVMSEFESVMIMLQRRISDLTVRVSDMASRCTL